MDKTVLITGSALRLGRATAIHLAQKGWSVALHYNQSENAALQLAKELRSLYPNQKFETFAADLLNTPATELLIQKVNEKMGPLRVLINNASLFDPSYLSNTTAELFDSQISVNLKAPLLLMRDFATICKKGVIINFVDTRITNNRSNFAAYSLSKKALWEATKMAALELGPHIRVNAIAPGLTLAPADKGDDYLHNLSKHIAMQRPGGIDPILASIDYILENNYLTGQLLFCDGGENLGSVNND